MPPDQGLVFFSGLLHHHETLRNCFTIILIIGVCVELLIDEFWEFEQPPLLRGRKATKLLIPTRHRLKKLVLLFVGFVLVGGGIEGEFWYGNATDQDSETISRIQQRRIADAESEQAAFERLVSPRQLVLNDDFKRLSKFKGTPFWTQTIEWSRESAATLTSADFSKIGEANSFAASFGMLANCCGWTRQTMLQMPSMLAGVDTVGIHIYSRRADPYEPWMESESHWPDPYAVILDTPERKGWAAAEALKQYVQTDLGFSVQHTIIDDIHGNLLPEFANFPSDAVIIRVGEQTLTEDIEEHVLMHRSDVP